MIRLTALRHIETLSSGHSRPCIIEGETIEGDRHEVVLKLRESVHGKVNGLACEWVASRIARAVGLNVPQHFLVEVGADFADSVPDAAAKARYHTNLGVHFGSALVGPQTHAIPFNYSLPENLVDQAAAVIAFDALIGNDDRHVQKTNYLIRGAKIILIDHERAVPIARHELRAEPWLPTGLDFVEKHVFFPGVKGELADWAGVEANWRAITPQVITTIVQSIPQEWDADGVADRLETYLLAMHQNVSTVIRFLQILLR